MTKSWGGLGPEASQRLEGLFPGLPKRVDELVFQQLGKPLIILRDGRNPNSIDQIAGVALPLQPDELKHFVIMKNGIMVVVEPNCLTGVDPEYLKNLYLESFGMGRPRLEYVSDWNIQKVTEDLFSRYPHSYSRVVLRSDDPSHLEGINQSIGQALEVARKVKEQRDRVREETARRMIEEIDKLLNPPTDQPKPNSGY